MPTTFEIIASRGVVVIRHSGHITVAESQASYAEFSVHPDARLGQHHLVDCSAITSYERDFGKIIALQAQMTDGFPATTPEMLLILYAPAGPALEVATIIRNSWAGSGYVIPRIVAQESEALAILGLPEAGIAELLALN